MARYGALFSGSQGNSTFVGTATQGLLIDVGVSAKRIEEALRQREICPDRISGVLITHEHCDHIQGLRVLTKRYHWPVYASEGTLTALMNSGGITPGCDVVPLYDREPIEIGDMQVTPFHTPHDARESMGFCIETPDERKIGIATDMGVMWDEVERQLSLCDLVHIESNHDVNMLKCGPYPYPLQQRILSDRGHLSNEVCAEVVARLAMNGVARFTLAHLSANNNTPGIARRANVSALGQAGLVFDRDYLLETAAPVSESPLTIF